MSTLATVIERPTWAHRLRLPPVLGALLALVLAAMAGSIVFVMKLGPVIAVIDAEGGHGVHSGDLWALPLAAAGLLLLLLLAVPARP